jgi:hypothetical protein
MCESDFSRHLGGRSLTTITHEERAAFFGSFGRDVSGSEHLLGLTASETATYLLFRRKGLLGETVLLGISENIALYEKHRRACKLRLIEPGA